MGNERSAAHKDKSGARPGLIQCKRKRRSLNLEELYGRHGEDLYRYLVFRLGSAEDAEDVLQECFCRFARYDLRWRLVRDPRAFVFRVARNEANRFLRRRIGRREGEAVIVRGARNGFTAAFVPPDEPSSGPSAARGRGPSAGTERGRLSEGLRRPDLQGDRVGLRRVGQHGRQPVPVRDRKAPRGRGRENVKDDRSEATGYGAPDIETELGRLAPVPVPLGLRSSGSWIEPVSSGGKPCFRRG